jgi:hypothetical protein
MKHLIIPLTALVLLAAAPPTPDLGYWNGLRSFSGQWPIGVIDRTDRVADWGDRLISGLSVDAPTSRFVSDLKQHLGVQNLERIYNTLPVSDGPGRRIVGLGAPTGVGKGYAFTLFRTRDFPGDLDAPFGNWRGTLTLDRTVAAEFKNRTLYRTEFLGDLSLGDFSSAEILGFWEGFLKTAERVVRGPDVSAADRRAILARHPLLDRPSDLKLWQAFAQDMPGLTRFFDRFLLVQALATPRHHPMVGDYVAADLHWGIRHSTFQTDFPALADRFRKMGWVMELRGSLRNSDGHRVASYRLETDRGTMRCQILLKDGKLLPFDLEDEPIPKARPLQFVDTRSEDMTLLASLHVAALGVTIDVDNLRFQIRIVRGPTSGNIEAALAGMDRLAVDGKVLGFIPMSLVNAVVPIEEGTRDSMDVAIRGFAGLGTRIGMGFDNPGDGKPAHWRVSASTISIENRFLQFVLRVMGSGVLVAEKEQAEIGRIFREAYDSVSADYRDVRKRVRVLDQGTGG